MKVLKSPVLYFGILLLVAVLSALAAPYVVDWGQYRGGLQSWGEKLTGRQTAIRGDISVKLFPFPELTANDIVIANPDGFKEPIFAHIDRVSVRITLGGLVNGDLQVEAINLEGPTVTFMRTAEERFNWMFEPAGTVRNSPLLEHVLLDQIKVINGRAFFVDEVRSVRSEVDNIQATVSSPSLIGPWRSTGTLRRNGSNIDFALNTAAWQQAQPFGMVLRLTPTDQAGYSLIAEAQAEAGGRFAGHLTLAPVVDPEGKGDTEGRMRSVTISSDFVADFRRIDLKKIEIRPADAKDQGTLITGNASAEIGQVVTAKIEMSAPRVDLDALAGAGSRQLLRDGGGLALLNGLIAGLPSDLEITAGIDILALKAGGENLDNGRVSFTANRQEMRLHKLSANLPGRSRVLFDGVFYPGDRTSELSGNLALETFDARALSGWLFPEAKAEIARLWTRNRGHLKMANRVRLTASKLEFSDVNYEFNGDAGTGRLSVLVNGERPIVDISLHARRLDIDGSLTPTQANNKGTNWAWLLQNFSEQQSRRDLSLAFVADSFILNGVEAQGLTANVETSVRGFDLKTLEIADVGGAKVSAAGLIINSEAGADGDITAEVGADDPRPLLQLFGAVPRGGNPVWVEPLGKTHLKFGLAARAGEAQGTVKFAISGSSGDFLVSGEGVIGAQHFESMTVKGNVELKNRSSAGLWRLLGGANLEDDSYSSRLALYLDGQVQGDMRTKIQTEIYGMTFAFEGTTKLDGITAVGTVKANSADAGALLSAIKVPLLRQHENEIFPLGASATVKFANGKMDLSSITGAWGSGPFAGELHLSHDGKLSGELNVAKFSLVQAAALAFLPWNGSVTLESLFASSLPAGLSSEVWVHAKQLEFYPGLSAQDGQLAITMQVGDRQLSAYGKGADGEKLSVEARLNSSAKQNSISGSVVLPFDLAQVLGDVEGGRPFAGKASVDIKFSGEGLSPAACLSTMKGSGAFSLVGVSLRGISPERFTQTSRAAKDPAALQRSLEAMKVGAGIAMRPTFGSLSIENGVAKVTPFSFETPDAQVTLNTTADLSAGLVNIATGLGLKALPSLPRMAVVYSGQPNLLRRQEEAGDLAAFLGFKVLSQSVDELERLQAEQVRLVEREEAQRREDALKLALYTAQRTELRLRQRELRTWTMQRQRDDQHESVRLTQLSSLAKTLTEMELGRRLREMRAYSQ